MPKTGSSFIEERRVVNAPPTIVFTVITSAADLVGWLCNEARCDPHPGGVYELGWRQGYAVHGKVSAVKKDKLFAVTWRGTAEPGETKVKFTLTRKDKGTEVVVRQSGFGRGRRWQRVIDESLKGWGVSLANLQYLMENGVDLREARRPMMGISVGEALTAERAAKEGIDAKEGLYLEGVADGLSAQAAGLQARDVIMSIDGKPATDFNAVVAVLQAHVAGDKVEVAYVRGKEHRTVTLELKPRPMPDVPEDPKALLAALLERYEKARTEVVGAAAGAGEERAARKPAPDEWSAKETIAHLCVTERDLQYWLGDVLLGNVQPDMPGNVSIVPEKLAATLAGAPTVAALLNRLGQDQADTLAMIAALRPEIVANKARYTNIGQTLFRLADHVHEHVAQIKAALAAK